MPRKYRRRRRKFLTPKKGTIFSILAMLTFLGTVLITLSFFQEGTVLNELTTVLNDYFGMMKYLLPGVLIPFSLLMANLKVIKLRPNIPIGITLIFLCLLGLAQSGQIGVYIWLNFADRLSEIGAFMLLSIMLLIGLVVLFNTSIEEISKFAETIFSGILQAGNSLSNKKKPVFVEKLPIKAPVFNSPKYGNKEEEKTLPLKTASKR